MCVQTQRLRAKLSFFGGAAGQVGLGLTNASGRKPSFFLLGEILGRWGWPAGWLAGLLAVFVVVAGPPHIRQLAPPGMPLTCATVRWRHPGVPTCRGVAMQQQGSRGPDTSMAEATHEIMAGIEVGRVGWGGGQEG